MHHQPASRVLQQGADGGDSPASSASAPPERLAVSVNEAARLLGVSRDLVYDLVARGELPAIRLGRRLVVARRSLQNLLAGQPDGAAPEPGPAAPPS